MKRPETTFNYVSVQSSVLSGHFLSVALNNNNNNKKTAEYTVLWHTWSGALLLCVTSIEWRVCISVGGCAAVRLALWHRGGGCVRIWWSLLGFFCFLLYVRCVHNEKSSAVSHVIKGIIRRGFFVSIFMYFYIAVHYYFFPELWFWI